MPETRQEADVPRHELTGPTYQELGHRDMIDWHYHDVPQLVYPSSGVLAISTALGTWIVPPQRAVWIPARVAHAHQAHGPTQMRTLAFPASVDPLGPDNPAVLTVSGLLREIIAELTSCAEPAYTARQRADLERVALDQIRRVGQLPVLLPALADDRLQAIAGFFRQDPADHRTLAEFGAAAGASERTLSPAVPAAGRDELPAVAHPVPAAARAGPARGRHVRHQHGARLRLVQPERVHRSVSARVRQHSRALLHVVNER